MKKKGPFTPDRILVLYDEISRFCSTYSLWDKMKVVFIDECEYLSKNAQAAMRGTIEKHSHIPFLLTANDTSKLHAALKSRCLEVCFDVRMFEVTEIVERLLPSYQEKIKRLRCDVEFEASAGHVFKVPGPPCRGHDAGV